MKQFINCLKQNNQKVIICCNSLLFCLVIFSPPGQSKKNPHYKETVSPLCPLPPSLFPPTRMFSHTQLGRTEARTTQPSPHHKLCSGGGLLAEALGGRSCSGEELGSETNPMSLSQCVLGQDGSLPWASVFITVKCSLNL